MIFKGGCMNPLAIQAFVKSTGENALNARQVFETFDPDKGLVCKDSDQVSHFYIQMTLEYDRLSS